MRRMSVLHQNSGVIGKSIPSALEISLHPRGFPQPSRFPSGFALGKSLGSREISWASGMDFPFSHHRQGRIDFNTVNPSLPTGMDFEGRGKSRGRRGWISQYLPSFGGVQTFSSSSILSLGMDQEIYPSRQGRIDSLKINPSLLRMREC